MEKYEITYLCEEDKSVDVKKILEENLAKIEKETDLGVRALAYPIGKVTRARYSAIRFELAPSDLAKLEKTLRLNRELVRFLIVKNPPEAPIKTIKAPEIEKPPVKIETPAEKVETPIETKEIEVKPAKPEPAQKIEVVEKEIEPVEKKPAVEAKKIEKKTKPRPKPVKIAKDELDEKLKELTLD